MQESKKETLTHYRLIADYKKHYELLILLLMSLFFFIYGFPSSLLLYFKVWLTFISMHFLYS